MPDLPLTGVTVLVVEDEYFLADDLKGALIDHGATIVGPVATVEDARQLAQMASLDFAILDVNLKGEMVFALADDLDDRGIPFIFVTGYDAATIPPKYQERLRLQKPFSERAVIDSVISGLP